MEIKSIECYILNRINEFKYEDFSPENSQQIHQFFKKIFYKETPYWRPYDDRSKETFYLEFKKYGDNRKTILLKFFFEEEIILHLKLTDDRLKTISENDSVELEFSEIWKDHSILFEQLKKIITRGLSLAEKH
jgi:hypothetical protein